MGAGSKDLESARKRVEDLYPYTTEGVAAMLDDFYWIEASAYDRGDYHAYTVLTDLKLALDTDCLTPRQRQVVALYHFAELTYEQVAEILDVGIPRVKKYLDAAYERIANEMKNGGAGRRGRKVAPLVGSRPLYAWANAVADGAPVYEIPAEVETDLLHWLSERGDDRAWETLHQRRHGAPDVPNETAGSYPALNARQYKYRKDREFIPPNEVLPARETVGYYTDKEGRRRRIFKF